MHNITFDKQVLYLYKSFQLLRNRALNMEHLFNNKIIVKVGSTKEQISQKALKSGGQFFDMLEIRGVCDMVQNFIWWQCGAFEL